MGTVNKKVINWSNDCREMNRQEHYSYMRRNRMISLGLRSVLMPLHQRKEIRKGQGFYFLLLEKQEGFWPAHRFQFMLVVSYQVSHLHKVQYFPTEGTSYVSFILPYSSFLLLSRSKHGKGVVDFLKQVWVYVHYSFQHYYVVCNSDVGTQNQESPAVWLLLRSPQSPLWSPAFPNEHIII